MLRAKEHHTEKAINLETKHTKQVFLNLGAHYLNAIPTSSICFVKLQTKIKIIG